VYENRTKFNSREIIALLMNCTNCGHCVELRGPQPEDPEELKNARLVISETFKKWIKQQ